MAKEVAIGKRAKISQAQQYMLLSVLGASVFLGTAIALVIHFVDQISFNTRVIAAEEQTIASYTDVIKSIGICKAPNGSVYSDSELENCNPESIETSEIPGTLRANILENLAANESLSSVPQKVNASCINEATNKRFTYEELSKNYANARGPEQLQAASDKIKSCSALRIIPEALPASLNEEALLASLNNLFIIAGWEPESISPGGASNAQDSSEDESESSEINSLDGTSDQQKSGALFQIGVNLSVEANTGTTMNVLNVIERSIREFNVQSINIEWNGNDSLKFDAQAAAYFMNKSTITETTKVIDPEKKDLPNTTSADGTQDSTLTEGETQ